MNCLNDVGLIGLGVMGANLALNIRDKGYCISVYNHKPERTKEFMSNPESEEGFSDFYDIKSFVDSLAKPRKIILMIVSGRPVDNMIEELLPYLSKGDLIMDGGNTYFPDTNRRMEELRKKDLLYLGIGISGGESGARNGPSIMVGGSREAYNLVDDMLVKISAKVGEDHCCSYLGEGGAGHFVKMVHNGIEYGMMQAISEVYDIMRRCLKLSVEDMADIFERWNDGKLNSYLIEITSKILRTKDEDGTTPLVDMILDKAGQKGTGRWTVETSLKLGIPAPSLGVAVESRHITFFKENRSQISKRITKDYPTITLDNGEFIDKLEDTLLFVNFMLFSQGTWIINEASKEYGFHIDIPKVFEIWKGGCIIRASMLDFLVEISSSSRENTSLLNSRESLEFSMERLDAIRAVASIARDYYIPAFAINTSLDYFYSMIEENLPANLIQAQRDFFGAHTYRRMDREGVFHTQWE